MLVFPAALGAVAAVRATGRAAPYAAVALGAVCVASPVLAAVGMSRAVAWSDGHPVVACDRPSRSTRATRSPSSRPRRGQNAKEAVALSLFAETGAHQFYVPRPRIRYRGIFRHIPPQHDRRRRRPPRPGGAAPPARDGRHGAGRGSGRHETPHRDGTLPLNPYALGRFHDADYTLYRVVR